MIRLGFVLAVASVACAVGACKSGEEPRHVVRFSPASSVPHDIASYPHVLYGDDAAYLVGDRWYYRTLDGWVVFDEEPAELERVRRAMTPRPPVGGERLFPALHERAPR
jgi:hypothetical protein